MDDKLSERLEKLLEDICEIAHWRTEPFDKVKLYAKYPDQEKLILDLRELIIKGYLYAPGPTFDEFRNLAPHAKALQHFA